MSKKHFWIALPLVFLAGAFWLHQPNNSPCNESLVQGLESPPTTNTTGRSNDESGYVPVSGAPEPVDEMNVPQVRDVYGGGVPFLVADLPTCPLRWELESLAPAIQDSALKRLAETSFHKNDLESLHVSKSGMPYYACTFTRQSPERTSLRPVEPLINTQAAEHVPIAKADIPASQSTSLSAVASISVQSAPVPVASPPIRHSKAGSTRVLFLDFSGHVVTGTDWNADSGVSRWDCLPYDIDGDITTFSDLEQQNIIQVWERVAEDYAPFDVDVTTEEPANWTPTTGYALFTPSFDANGKACPHSGKGGVAELNVFGNSNYSYYSPAWINTDYSDGNDGILAESASHELGHNMGLSHDGKTDGTGYYGGHGSGDISWAPIMGAGDKNVTQWSKGEYYMANQFQDDLAIIAGKLNYRADDHGNTNATATALTVSKGRVTGSGIISSANDVDVFSFYSGAGAMCVTVSPYRCSSGTRGENLDVVARLYNSSGVLLQSNNISTRTDAAINYTSTVAGVYYLHISGTGTGDPLAPEPTGYTAYGSIGQYFISGEVPPATGMVVRLPAGGETWYREQTNVITWASGADVTGNVKIELYLNGTLNRVIASSVPNTGSYAWAAPFAQQTGTNCKIRVTSVNQPDIWDESDSAFSIVAGNGFEYSIINYTLQGRYSEDGYTFSYAIPAVPGGAVRIDKYTGPGGQVNIPDTIGGRPVYAIDYQAFYNCSSLTGVSIPSSVRFIGFSAFSGCTELTSVIIPPNAVINVQAFSGCSRLENVYVSAGVKIIPCRAFGGCFSLTNIFLPNDLADIHKDAFSFSGLSSITIPNGVTNIGESAFKFCRGLTSVTIGSGVTKIGQFSFYECYNLTRVTMGSGIASIGDGAFGYCDSLKSVYFNGNAPAVGADVFDDYSNATVYYRVGTAGWGTTFAGRPTAVGCLLNITGNSCGRAYAKGTVVTNSVSSPVTDGGTRYVCAGWTMTGNVPLSGAASSFSMTLTNNATLTWRWSTDYYLTVITPSNGTVNSAGGWKPAGSVLTITADSNPGYRMGYWLVNGTERNKGQLTLALTNTAPTAVEIFFNKNVAMPWLNLLLD